MPPRLDPARREIAVGTRRLPFRLDLRNDRVSVTLGGAEMAVRPLQWREKLTLARFTHLGPNFLREEVIRLCTVTELPSPLAAEDAEVLWELAAWMSEPPTSTPVPLESRSLASVTIRLCREMGLKPADFDSRSAPEVEAMWEALGQAADHNRAEDAPVEDGQVSSATRIVIVPDGDSDGRETKAATGVAALRKPAEDAAQVPDTLAPDAGSADTQPQQALGRDTRSADAAPETSSLPETSLSGTSSLETPSPIARASVTSLPGTPPRLTDTDAPPRIASPRHAVATRGGSSISSSTPLEANETPARRTPMLVPPAPPLHENVESGSAVAASRSIGAMAMTRARHFDPLPRPIARVSSPPPSRADVALAPTPVLVETAGAESLHFAATASSPHVEQEWSEGAETMDHDIFETLADRLEQAAAEMGIGEG